MKPKKFLRLVERAAEELDLSGDDCICAANVFKGTKIETERFCRSQAKKRRTLATQLRNHLKVWK